MPDTPDPARSVEAIRKRSKLDDSWFAARDRDDLIAHIDALTAAVEGLPRSNLDQRYVNRAAVLAILRGEKVDPDAEAEAEFLKPIKPQGL